MKTKTYKFSAVIIIILANLLIASSLFAQAYEGMSYQAVIRDANNNLLTNQTIGMQVSILTGTAAAYVETHTPTTNANGLVSVEVGSGTIVSGYFPNIPWSYGGYSIKTEIDPTGGTNYTITASSMLLSVPFAINARDAETAEIAEVALIAENVIVYTAGDGIDITDNVVSNTAISTTYEVGDFAQGGVVFWVDETGQHGLVCHIEDFGPKPWTDGPYYIIMALGDGVYAGKMNTALIIANVRYNGSWWGYAAAGCNNFTNSGTVEYGDWYLPAEWELKEMYNNKDVINSTAIANGGEAFVDEYYWSSTEMGDNYAFPVHLGTGSNLFNEKHTEYVYRPIRAF